MTRRTAVAAITTLMLASAASTQPCNPVIDGTYCAELAPRSESYPGQRQVSSPFQSMGGELSSFGDAPIGTIGAITFKGDGSRCIGLLNRGKCK